MVRAPCDLMVLDAAELASLSGPAGPRRGRAQAEIGILPGGSVAVRGGRVVAVGLAKELRKRWKAVQEISASGCLVTPGLVDPHTHAVFVGDRAVEFEMRILGRSYQDIAAAGGGILSTVRAVRAASDAGLEKGLASRLDRMLLQGTTTAEVKSGYGLTLRDEIRQLEAVRRVGNRHSVRLVATFLGAHTVPAEFRKRRAAYVDRVCRRMIPEVARLGLARFCDVFVDRGAFTLAEGRRVLQAARAAGLGLKVHAEEFERTGISSLAARMGAASADHLMRVSDADIRALAASRTVAVCLPVTTLFVGEPRYAPARRMLEAGCAVAVATDLNPGSSHCDSLPLAMSLACLGLRMTPAEALTAVTINAAHALGMGWEVGSLELGKRADLVIWGVPSHRHLPYTMGANLARTVIVDGRVVAERGRLLKAR